MSSRVVLVLFGCASCAVAPEREVVAPAAAPTPPAPAPREAATPAPPTTPAGLSIAWSMHAERDALVIDYTFTNATASRVTVVDALLESGRYDEHDVIVRADADPDTIAFTRAFVPPEPGDKVYKLPRPRYHEIPAGETLRGTARTRLPLGAERNYGQAAAITGHRTRAVLEVGYFDDPALDARAAWSANRGMKLLRSESQPLPAGVTLASPQEQVDRSYGNVWIPPPGSR